MRTFPVVDRQAPVIFGALLVAFLTIFFLLPLGVLASAWLTGVLFVLGGVFIAARMVWVQIYEIRVHDDGNVEFRRRWTTRTVAARGIRAIAVKWTTDEDNDSYCHLHIRHGSRKIMVPCFPDAQEFLTQLRQ